VNPAIIQIIYARFDPTRNGGEDDLVIPEVNIWVIA
jgi:hypothetical protein